MLSKERVMELIGKYVDAEIVVQCQTKSGREKTWQGRIENENQHGYVILKTDDGFKSVHPERVQYLLPV